MCEMESLILCVEKHPCIWDTFIEDYHDREKKDVAWLDIFKDLFANWETLNEDEKKIKGLEVKRRWSNCRDYYKKYGQKLKSCPIGSAAKKGRKICFRRYFKFLGQNSYKKKS